MPYVDYAYYTGTYLGSSVESADFAVYETRAEQVIEAVTRYHVMQHGLASLPSVAQTLFKNAICAQVDYFAHYGLDLAATGHTEQSFTVGKVSITSGGDAKGAVAMVCPAAISMLEQTGLMSRSVSVPAGLFEPFPLGRG